MDLGIFRNGVLVERIEPDLTLPADGTRGREQTARAYDRMHEIVRHSEVTYGHEVLRICPNHPERSIVDCIDCDPEEER